jgi:hypothetical protein
MSKILELLTILFVTNGGLIRSNNVSWHNIQQALLHALAADNAPFASDSPCMEFARHLHELAGGTTASVARVDSTGTTIINMIDLCLPQWAELIRSMARLEVARRANHIDVDGMPTLWDMARDFVSDTDFQYPISTDVAWEINDPRIDRIIATA